MANMQVADDDGGSVQKVYTPEVKHAGFLHVEDSGVENTDPFAKKGSELKGIDGLASNFKRKVTTSINKVAQNVSGDTSSKQLSLGDVTAYNAFDVIQPPYNMDYLAKLYEMSEPHKAAVDAKVANIVGLGFKFQETSKTKRRLEDIEGDQDKLKRARKSLQRAQADLSDYFDDLNVEDTLTETLVKVWTDYETMGNGYMEISRKRDGTIGYIGHIDGKSIRIRKQRDGFVQMVSNKAVFFRNFGDRKTPNPFGTDSNPNEIIHIKNYSPTSAFYGVPDIMAAAQAIAGNEFSQRFNLDYFANKAIPRHVIILKGATLATATENALLQFFETGLKGQNHRTLYIPLPAGDKDNPVDLSIEPIEAGIQDSSFNNYRKANMNAILMAHRVPISKVSVGDGLSLAVARDADKTFKEQVCAPKQRVFEKKLNRIVKEITDAFEIKLNEMTLTDAETQSKIWERAVKNQWMVPNEVRVELGLPGLKGGDKVLDLKPQQAADARAQGTRARDAERSAGATDSAGEGRSPQGEGRTTP